MLETYVPLPRGTATKKSLNRLKRGLSSNLGLTVAFHPETVADKNPSPA